MKKQYLLSLLSLFLLKSALAAELRVSTSPITSAIRLSVVPTEKSDLNKSGIYDMGGKLFIDRNLEVSKGIKADRYIEIVSTAIPTAPTTGKARFFMSNSSNTLCAIYSNGGISCFGLNTTTSTIVAGSVVAHDPLRYNSGTGDLTLNPVSLTTGTVGAYVISAVNTDGNITIIGSTGAITLNLNGTPGLLNSTQTWTGQNTWNNPKPSTFTYGVTVGSLAVVNSGGSAGSITVGNWVATVIGTQYGGTGGNNTGAAAGGLMYATGNGGPFGTTTAGLTGQVLQSSGSFGTPSWISSTTFGLPLATQTWTGQNNWTTPSPSSFTYNVNVGSITGAGLTSCGDNQHALAWSSLTGTFSCQLITGTTAGNAVMAISSGSATNSIIVSSPTSNVVFDSNTFSVTLQGSTSDFISLRSSSVTLQGNTGFAFLNSTQTWTASQTFTSSVTYTATVVISTTVGSNITFDNTSTHGIVGTTKVDTAASGNTGEYIESVVGNTNAGTTGQYKDITSIILTPGDWDLTGMLLFRSAGAVVSDQTILISSITGNSSSGQVNGSNALDVLPPTATSNSGATVSNFRTSLATNTTYYLKYFADYTSGPPTAAGRISARRIR